MLYFFENFESYEKRFENSGFTMKIKRVQFYSFPENRCNIGIGAMISIKRQLMYRYSWSK